jgi:hypothetical protein
MSQTIQADETGALLAPAGLALPGARFTVEVRGEVVILRRDPSTADEWWASTGAPEHAVATANVGSILASGAKAAIAAGRGFTTLISWQL